MSKQIELFKEVRKRFPEDTYKTLSKKFGIQQTRLFRLMSGRCELRASEYFQIKSALENDSSEIQGLINFLERHSFSLNRNDCNEIVDNLESKFLVRELASL